MKDLEIVNLLLANNNINVNGLYIFNANFFNTVLNQKIFSNEIQIII